MYKCSVCGNEFKSIGELIKDLEMHDKNEIEKNNRKKEAELLKIKTEINQKTSELKELIKKYNSIDEKNYYTYHVLRVSRHDNNVQAESRSEIPYPNNYVSTKKNSNEYINKEDAEKYSDFIRTIVVF